MEAQQIGKILEHKPDLAVIDRLDELRALGVKIERVQPTEAALLSKFGAAVFEVPQRELVHRIHSGVVEGVQILEYLVNLPEDRITPVVEATFEIFGSDGNCAYLFRYMLPVMNPYYQN